MMMRRYLCVLLIITVFSPLYAEDSKVFAPFVSRLQVLSEGPDIKLTWKDSGDIASGTYVIYRHTEEITKTNFSDAVKLAEVSTGTESYIDNPDDKISYYYAVLVKTSAGRIYDLFIPFRNKTTSGIAVETLNTVEELAARITGITTIVEEESILVSFSASKDDRDLFVYRGTTPIQNSSDLAFAQALRIIPSSKSSFQDFPVPGISYYYAVIDSGFIKVGDIEFAPGDNSTIIPATIPLGTRVGLPENYVTRSLPLPLHLLTSSIEDGSDLPLADYIRVPPRRELSSGALKSVNSLLAVLPSAVPPEPEPAILKEDRGSVVSGGEEYTLKSILNKEFGERRWLEAESLLKKYLSVHRSRGIEERARFYLGQALYFQEKHREALLEFVLVRDSLYAAVSPFLKIIFFKIDQTF